MMIYICSPLRGETNEIIRENMMKTREYIDIINRCLAPKVRSVAPHAYLPEMLDDNDPTQRELALDFGLKLLSLCDTMIVVGDRISEGMRGEIEIANQKDMPVTYVSDEVMAQLLNSEIEAIAGFQEDFSNMLEVLYWQVEQ